MIFREKSHHPTRIDKKFRIFHPGAYIPESERFASTAPLLPGPGRYDALPVACPCQRGTEYLEDSAKTAEYQKWKYSPYYSNPQRMKPCTCESPQIRNIPGKGLTSVFKSGTKRLLDKPKTADSSKKESRNDEKLPTMLDANYLRSISQPKRKTLSFRSGDEVPPKQAVINFNTTAKVMPRQKLRANKAVAFMSSCPRFEGDGGKDTFLANRNILVSEESEKPSNQNLSKTMAINRFATSKDATERLVKLPQRYEYVKEKILKDKLGNLFQHLPKAKILLNEMKFYDIK